MNYRRIAWFLGIVGVSALAQGCASARDSADEDEPAPTAAAEPKTDGEGTDPAPPAAADPAADAPAATPAAVAKSKMTFFVTSVGSGNAGGNLGGVTGADKKCTDLATAVKGGDHTWHAYLSTKGNAAKDRIGPGPWFNHAGKQVADSVAALHAYAFNILGADSLDETGKPVPAKASLILTGSNQNGTPLGATCADWTSNAANQVVRGGDVGADKSVILGIHWNNVTKNVACTAAALAAAKSEGRTYCFAID